MNKATHRFTGLNDKRMFSVEEAAFYTGMGTTRCRAWLQEIGAVRKFGSRVLCDKKDIDEALDRMKTAI